MTRVEKTGFFQRFFQSRIFLLSLIGVFGIVALSYARAYYQNYRVQEEIAMLEEQVRGLEKKKLESLEILDYVQSDLFVEEVARTELNMKKPGENVVVIHGAETERLVSGSSVEFTQRGKHLSNPQKWWYYFVKPGTVVNK